MSVTDEIQDGLTLTRRSLKHTTRVPELLVFSTIQPVMFVLLFAFVFGGAIKVPGGSYREFLLPGIFVQTVAFASAATAVGVAEDMSKGLVDRFRSLPMARSAVLVGRTTADATRNILVVAVMAACGLAVGWRVHDGVLDAVHGVVLLLAFGLAMSWVGALIGLAVPNPEVAQSAGFIWLFPLTFVSPAFASTTTFPSWLEPIANWNPVSAFVWAQRALYGNPNPKAADVGFPGDHPVLLSWIYIVVILAIFVPLAVRKYRTATSR